MGKRKYTLLLFYVFNDQGLNYSCLPHRPLQTSNLRLFWKKKNSTDFSMLSFLFPEGKPTFRNEAGKNKYTL